MADSRGCGGPGHELAWGAGRAAGLNPARQWEVLSLLLPDAVVWSWSCWRCPSPPALVTSPSSGTRNVCSHHDVCWLEAWGRKQRRAWEQALAPVLGVDVSGGYQLSLRDLPSPGMCLWLSLPLLQLCIPVPCLIDTQLKCASIQHKIMRTSCLGLTFPGREVKPYGDACSLSPLDGAKSCSHLLSFIAERSLLHLLLGANEASRAVCLLQFGKMKCPVQNPSGFYHLYKVASLSMW